MRRATRARPKSRSKTPRNQGLPARNRLAKIAAVTVPVLVTHGTRDEVIPADQFDRLYAAIRAPKTRAVLEGATHVDLARHGSGDAALRFIESVEAAP